MLGQNARDVDRDVADPDDGHGLRAVGQMHDLAVVGVAAVPGDELRRGKAAREIFTGDSQPAVVRRADGKNDRVVVALDVLHGEIGAEVHVAEEAHPRVFEGLVERRDDRLDLRVIGRHAVADQAVRCMQTFDDVDADRVVLRLEQRIDEKKAGRSGADDGDAQR